MNCTGRETDEYLNVSNKVMCATFCVIRRNANALLIMYSCRSTVQEL
jgi:hypothetical protein